MVEYNINSFDILALQSHIAIIDVLHDFRTSSKSVCNLIDNLTTGNCLDWTPSFERAKAGLHDGNFPFGAPQSFPISHKDLLRLIANKTFAYFYDVPYSLDQVGLTPTKWRFTRIDNPILPLNYVNAVDATKELWNKTYQKGTGVANGGKAAHEALEQLDKEPYNVINYLENILREIGHIDRLNELVGLVRAKTASKAKLNHFDELINFTADFLRKIYTIWITPVPSIDVNNEGYAFGSDGPCHLAKSINTHGMVILLISAGLISLLNIYILDPRIRVRLTNNIYNTLIIGATNAGIGFESNKGAGSGPSDTGGSSKLRTLESEPSQGTT